MNHSLFNVTPCELLVVREGKQHTQINLLDRSTEFLEYSHDLRHATGATCEEKSFVRFVTDGSFVQGFRIFHENFLALSGLGAIEGLHRCRSRLSAVENNETFTVPHYSMLHHVSCGYRVREGKQHTQGNVLDRSTEFLEYSLDLRYVTGATCEEKFFVRDTDLLRTDLLRFVDRRTTSQGFRKLHGKSLAHSGPGAMKRVLRCRS